ncbi:MAG: archaetidylinositol phosphate synthase [Desulfurococcus sp.]|nr:archaetidylinositol phosphate synthase [Desulfurococcus sp.]
MLNRLREKVSLLVNLLVKPLVALNIHPNTLTVLSMLVLLTGALVFTATHSIPLYMAFIAFSGIFDMLDGALARATGKTSRFGAFLDSVVDRVNDSIMIWSLTLLGLNQLCVTVLLVASLLTSYTRARGESLGVPVIGVGLVERPERIIGLVFILILYMVSEELAVVALVALTALSVATVIQRVVWVYKRLRSVS